MPKLLLTDRFIQGKGCKAIRGKRTFYFDTVVPAFAVKVSETAKSFVLCKRFAGHAQPAPRALGRVGVITLEHAREKARRWTELLRKGIDPSAEEEQQRQAELRKRAHSLGAVLEDYVKHIHRAGQRKAADVERQLRRELLPRWGSRPVTDITDDDVRSVVRAAVARGATYEAYNLFGSINTLFGWAIGGGDYGVRVNPCAQLRPSMLIGKPRAPRQRMLEEPELRAFWRATGRMDYPWRDVFRMLLLTGQRRSEVLGARWREFDDDVTVWTVPPERFKSKSTHLVPISADVRAMLEGLPRFKRGDHLFSATFGAKPIASFSKAKARLDKAMLAELRAEDPDAVLPAWKAHDLRRVVRTYLSKLRIPDTVAEQVIGHGRRGIQRVYDQHRFLDQMREALELWDARLRDIVEPPPANVVALRALQG
jgi:integrase